MYNWQGKKLLVLGATKFQSEIVKQAQKYGAYVYVIDYYENSPAKKIADESFLINAVDVDSAVKLIKEKNINGVLTGFADSLLPAYKEICEKAKLPCYITNNEQLKFSTEKQVFKNYLNEFGIPYVADLKETDKKEFPLIVKPVDNSGARGICICNNEEELQQGILTALKFSKSKKYLLEKYLNYKEATVFYLFADGKPYFTLMGDRHIANVKDGFIKLPTGYTFPSPYSKKFYEETHPKFVKLFEKLQIKNGMMFIQCFIDENGNCIPYESGFRLTGSLEYILLENVSGYNPLAMMINYALTGKMCAGNEISKINPFIEQKSYNISCLIKPGTIEKISGIDELKKQEGIVDIFSSYDENDTISDDMWGKLAQIAIRIFIVPNSENHYILLQKKIEKLINITSTQNHNMLINKKIEEKNG